MSQFAIGIDIGGTNTKFGVVDRNGHILVQDRMLTNEHETVQEFIEDLHQKLDPMIKDAGGTDKFVGIGMGAPNGNFYSGSIEYAPNLKWKGIIPLASMINDRFGLPNNFGVLRLQPDEIGHVPKIRAGIFGAAFLLNAYV